MARHASRVRETSTTTGTGTLDLAGAVSGFRTFVAGIGTGKSVYYTIRNRDVPTEWEVGVGIVTDASTDTLSRVTVIRSSNSDALVNFSAGTKDVYVSVGEESLNRLQQIPLRVKCATTANITLSGTQTIDGVSAGVGDRVLVKSQSTASQNGIYVVASGSWTRSVDCATGDPASCMLALVDQGTVGANTVWICTTNSGSDVVGTNSLAFARIDSQAITGTAAGILCSDGAGAINPRTLTAPDAGITVSNGTGASGNPTLALADDLAAVEGISTTGMVARTASNTWVPRTIAGGTGVTVTNGDGVAGAPSIAIGQAVATTSSPTFAGLTVGDGTAEARVNLNSAGGTTPGLFWKTNNSNRWLFYTTNPETGSDAGTDLVFGRAYDDSGVGIDNPITITRAAGGMISVTRPIYSDQKIEVINDLLLGTTTAPTVNGGKSLVFGASAGNVTPGASTCGLFGKTVTQVEVFAVDSAANVTQLSPHPDKVMEKHAELCDELGVKPAEIPWGYESEQAVAGIVTRVDLAAVVRLVEMLASERLGKPVKLLIEEQVPPSIDWDAREAEADAHHERKIAVYQQQVIAFREQVAQRQTLPPLLRAQSPHPLFAGGRKPARHRTEKPKYLGADCGVH